MLFGHITGIGTTTRTTGTTTIICIGTGITATTGTGNKTEFAAQVEPRSFT